MNALKLTAPAMGEVHHTAIVGSEPEDRTHEGPSWQPVIMGARLSAFVTVDSGTKRPTVVNAGTWLLAHSHVGHDALVGRDCTIATGAVVGGWAELGDRVKVGLNAVILPFRKVGDDAVIGAGAIVTRDVPAGETWTGNPARRLEDSERDPRPHSERCAS